MNDRIRATATRAAPATVFARIQAGHPRSNRLAEERAAEFRAEGQPATVVMDLDTDDLLVIADAVGVAR